MEDKNERRENEQLLGCVTERQAGTKTLSVKETREKRQGRAPTDGFVATFALVQHKFTLEKSVFIFFAEREPECFELRV